MTRLARFGVGLCALVLWQLSGSLAFAAEARVEVHVDQPQASISPVLYGLFFEDINYAADGGIYAELVQNRSFEFYPVEGWGRNGHRLRPLTAWSKVELDGGRVELVVEDAQPLNENNTKYLRMTLSGDGAAGVRNRGFEGMPVTAGDQYDFSVYARGEGLTDANVTVAIVSEGDEVLAQGVVSGVGQAWEKQSVTLSPSKSDKSAKLVLTTKGNGTLCLDMVSLFPQKTFKGRKNGMRPDLAQALADLNPTFLRFPGGCIAHGHGLANAYRWKDTVGDVAQRKPNWNLWGYHQTYGLGYFEYMQLCEDIGATPLPVVPVGASCGFRRPFQFVPMQELDEWIQDALDLVEFANGSTNTKWGALRAEMGHPESFNLKYLCLGNEEHDTREVRERFPKFVEAIRAKYPEIKLIGTSGLGPGIPIFDLMKELEVHSTDEHYYMPPSWYLNNVGRFDSFNRQEPKVFVGEYASEGNAQYNAVAEAAYLTGIERNGDIVDMACYAPLFAKYDFTQWPRADLIWFDNHQVVRTANYYVQQLFSQHAGDAYLKNQVEVKAEPGAMPSYAGQVGVASWLTAIEVESAKLDGQAIALENWQSTRGDFALENGVLVQSDSQAEAAVSVAPGVKAGTEAVFETRIRKTNGAEGFLLVFGYEGSDEHYWMNFGGWGNTQHGLERVVGNRKEQLAQKRGSVEANRWYDARVELSAGSIQCYLDNELIFDYQHPSPTIHVSPTIDNASGKVMVKLVNPADTVVKTTVKLSGAAQLDEQAELITLAGPADAVNTRDQEAIKPVLTTMSAATEMTIELPPTSVQVLRVKVK